MEGDSDVIIISYVKRDEDDMSCLMVARKEGVHTTVIKGFMGASADWIYQQLTKS